MGSFDIGNYSLCLRNSDAKILLSEALGYKPALYAIKGSYNGMVANLDDPTYLTANINQGEEVNYHFAEIGVGETSEPATPTILNGSVDDTYDFDLPFSLGGGVLTFIQLEIDHHVSLPGSPPNGIFCKMDFGGQSVTLNKDDLVVDGGRFIQVLQFSLSCDYCGSKDFEFSFSSGQGCDTSTWMNFQVGCFFAMFPYGDYTCPDTYSYLY
jgi:hypothetical protein